MELAEGDTLRDRVKRGPLPLEESLDIVKQIAAGLEAAHEKPIVHRDLKPANVKVTPEGVVKILDFGLARAFAGDTGSSDPSDSPTLTGMTQPGTILGTAAYMSPEQARGRRVDKRTDIWALGCVLYEMLTGQKAFQSRDREGAGHEIDTDTVQDILARILAGDPDWSSLPASTPPNVRFVLRRCLEKDPKRRFHAATDVAIALEEPWSVSAAEAAPTPAASPRPLWQRAIPVLLAVVVTAIIAGLAVWNLRPSPPPQLVSRTAIPLPADEGLAVSNFASEYPLVALSPDGQWIGFLAEGALRKVSVSGGGALILADDPNYQGAAWGPDDSIIFSGSATGGLSQISTAGGTPLELTKLQEGERSHRWPQFLPDGKTIIFTVTSEGNIKEILTIPTSLHNGSTQASGGS